MKKKNYLLNFVFIIALIEILNRILFKYSSVKYKKIQSSYKFYPWKLGNIHYRVEGKGSPLLLIHGIGNGASSYEWRKNISYLSKNFKVYTIDLLGFGYSSKPKVSYTAFLYVQLIQDFIKQVIKEPTFVIANSQSASFTVMACASSPGLFKKMILLSPTGIKKQSNYPILKSKIIKNIIEFPIIGTIIFSIMSSKIYTYYFIKKNLYRSSISVSSSLIDAYHGAARLGGPSARYLLASFLGNYINVNVNNVLPQLSCPICIIWGKGNTLVPVSLLNEWERTNPNISSNIFEKSRSMPQEEEPLKFNEICKIFLQKRKDES